MVRIGIIALIFIGLITALITVLYIYKPPQVLSPLGITIEKPLEKYSIDNLKNRVQQKSQIVLEEAIATRSAYTRYRFSFQSDGKKVTGLANIPNGKNDALFPVIVQIRGYVPREIFTTGEGTKRSGEVFAGNGFVTLAPDFLGYGGSDTPSGDIFEERFQAYTTVLDLLASIPTLSKADASKVGLWGHSNGGHIALTILEILGKPLPTSLWAPVTKPFPYSILYYTDEAPDLGKFLRKNLAKFEEEYDVNLYSLTNYLGRITAAIQVQQDNGDEAVPIRWTEDFVKRMKELGRDITYYTYPGGDHNLQSNWNLVVQRDVIFFQNKLGEPELP